MNKTHLLAILVFVAFALSHCVSFGQSITAWVESNGELVVVGTNDDEKVAIRPTAQESKFVVQGLDGTTVNGKSKRVFGSVTSINVDLSRGDDSLLVTNRKANGVQAPFVLDGDFFMRGFNPDGLGSDLIVFNSVQLGSLDIGSGALDDFIHVFKTDVIGNAVIESGHGNNAVELKASNFFDLEVWGGADSDTFFYNRVQVIDDLYSNGENGNDLTGAKRCVTGDRLILYSGTGFANGNDGLWVKDNSFGSFSSNSVDYDSKLNEVRFAVESHPLHAEMLQLIDR